jgi:hypothetical protein
VNQGRREFLKTILRFGALAGLAAAVIGPLMRKAPTCAQARKACAACDRYAQCDLPEALDQKRGAGGVTR